MSTTVEDRRAMEPCSSCGRDRCVFWRRDENGKWSWVCLRCGASREIPVLLDEVLW